MPHIATLYEFVQKMWFSALDYLYLRKQQILFTVYLQFINLVRFSQQLMDRDVPVCVYLLTALIYLQSFCISYRLYTLTN